MGKSTLEEQFETVCEHNRKLLGAIRRAYVELQKKEPDVVMVRRILGSSYPGGLSALVKASKFDDPA